MIFLLPSAYFLTGYLSVRFLDWLNNKWFYPDSSKTSFEGKDSWMGWLCVAMWPIMFLMGLVMILSDRIMNGKTLPSSSTINETQKVRLDAIKSQTVKLQEEDPDYLAALEEIEDELNSRNYKSNLVNK